MNRTLLLGMTSLLLFSASAGCGSGHREQSAATIPPDLTLAQLYASVEKATTGRGTDVLHVAVVSEGFTLASGTPVSTPEGVDDYRLEDYANQTWLDTVTDSVRLEHHVRNQEHTSDRIWREIRQAGTQLAVDDKGNSGKYPASYCPQTDSTRVSVLLGCTQEYGAIRVEPGEYKGKPAILLIARGELELEHSKKNYFEQTVRVDPTTYLPLSAEVTSSNNDPTLNTYDYKATNRYVIDIVKRSSLAVDFFEPTAIGYVTAKPVAADNLQADVKGMRVYWIGPDFDAGLAGPLVLQRVDTYPGEFSPGPRAALSYKIVDDHTGYRGIGIRQYPIGEGDKDEAHILGEWNKPDTVREDVQIQGRRAELRRLRDTRYGELYMLRIDFEKTIVVVSDYLGAPPYTGRDAILRIAAGLRPFEK